MDYVKVENKKVVEFYSPRSYANSQKPTGNEWLPLEKNKPTFNNKKEFLTHSHYEILGDKAIEHFKVEKINIYYAKVNDENDLETENVRAGTKALVNNEVFVFRKNEWQPLNRK